ncbi:MAG: HypC/HybG/HupF family hydrogenase formation chaperone [Gammaproteobacteria bacterium SHHR-1]|jgi:hydrogenase expression/formation protein HypC|uniref:HypC/HybG/HupF family hydrogenase formation chaperone n=1 Tax=Magnetovirga frankeli TaxID=947516 RepID=UPI001293C845|nr:HypC/HybG/HupF family hydrogenase formation chaperone [gamma proteobacterium SS-5]
MCLAIPAQVLSIEASDNTALVALGEVQKRVSLALVEDVQPGDYVLLHVGYALNKLSAEEAERTLALFAEADLLEEGAGA